MSNHHRNNNNNNVNNNRNNERKSSKVAFMVAEKPSLAAAVANILSDGKCTNRKSGVGPSGGNVHEWKGTLFGEDVTFRMIGVCGHIFSLDFVHGYNNWDEIDPVELFECSVMKKETNVKARLCPFLCKEARGADYLILWLDCDKEGENICFEVIDTVRNVMRRSIREDVEYDDTVWRARFSSITAKDIKTAMRNLVKPNKNEAMSVDVRQELDLRIGCAFTRYQTKYFQGQYGDFNTCLISFGPCQTPTLAFCVERHDEIQRFVPEPFWVLQIVAETKERELILLFHEQRIFNKYAAREYLDKVKSLKTLTVADVSVTKKTKSRPLALNTVELLKYASSGLGLSPQQTMSLAERLYSQGYISYPRTETSAYSANFNLREVLQILRDSSDYGSFVNDIRKDGITQPRAGTNVGDHPPITPMKVGTCEQLAECWKLYDYVVRHFLGTVSKDCKYETITVTFSPSGGKKDDICFIYSGDVLVDAGYTHIMTWQGLSKSRVVPPLKVRDVINVKDPCLSEQETSPPNYLTESELVTIMDKHGIGTDASIPVHIGNICQRNYVKVATARRLQPTQLGITLIHGYKMVDKDLVDSSIRSRLEAQLNVIARGGVNYKDVLKSNLETYKNKYVYFVNNIAAINSLFEVQFTPLAKSGKAFTRCGNCRRYMKLIEAKPQRLHCAQCNQTYNLPQSGTVYTYKDIRCPIDNFELVRWSAGVKGKSFPLCPHCFTFPPFEDMKKGSGCNNCANRSCNQSLCHHAISGCGDCATGVLALDPSSAPKWKVLCNNCNFVMTVFSGAQKVTVDQGIQCGCGSQEVKVEYKENETKLPGDRKDMVGCLFCSPAFKPLIKEYHSNGSKPPPTGGGQPVANDGSGGTRGRGRGLGRGRGRGRGGYWKKQKPQRDKMAELNAYFV